MLGARRRRDGTRAREPPLGHARSAAGTAPLGRRRRPAARRGCCCRASSGSCGSTLDARADADASAAVVPRGGSPRARLRLGGAGRRPGAGAHLDRDAGRLERFRPGARAVDRARRRRRTRSGCAARGSSCASSRSTGAAGHHFPYDGSGRLAFGDGALWSLEDHGVAPEARPARPAACSRGPTCTAPSATSPSAAASSGRRSSRTASSTGSTPRPARAAHARGRRRPERIAFADGRLWVANSRAGTVALGRPAHGRAAAPRLSAAAVGRRVRRRRRLAGTVPAPPPLPPAGGPELRLSFPGDDLPLDPALSHSTPDEQLADATCARLLTYPDAKGPPGKRSAPRLRPRCPRVPRDGRTYTFRIRDGLPLLAAVERAGDGRDVQAHARARLLAEARPRRARPERGAGDRRASPRSSPARPRHVSGIRAQRRQALDHARAAVRRLPRPDLAADLCAVPLSVADPPDSCPTAAAAAGPYYVASAADGRIVLLPNPGYGGSRPRRWARIVYTLDVPTRGGRRARRPRRARLPPLDFDITAPARRGGELDRRYGPAAPPRSAEGSATSPPPAVRRLLVLNASRPLFRDVRLRRAVNYALDRPALAAVVPRAPGDQIVPPAVAASRPARCIRVDGPDLETARRLAATGGRQRRAHLYVCPFGDDGLRRGAIVRANLARIGIDVAIVRPRCPPDYDTSSSRADLLLVTNFGSQAPRPPAVPRPGARPRSRTPRRSGPGPGTARRSGTASRPPAALRGPARTRAYAGSSAS